MRCMNSVKFIMPDGAHFAPAWWLTNPHLQTVWGTLTRRKIKTLVRRERLVLPDGDFLDLDWIGESRSGPIILILHGLGGSIHSPYVRGITEQCAMLGLRPLVMHFRGCSGEPNRLARAYHSGETGDLSFVVNWLIKREAHVPLTAVGYSLGANVLLKWLGETKDNNPLQAAAAISVPFMLQQAADHMMQGAARFYQWWLLRDLHQNLKEKSKQVPLPVTLTKTKSFWEFDEQVTAPLHGFSSAKDYYQKSSCKPYLKTIQTPTLIVHAKDDPLFPASIIPTAEELSPAITLEVTERGGHVGFIAGRYPWCAEYWLENRISRYLNTFLQLIKL